MDDELTRSEYWILDSVIRYGHTLHSLVSKSETAHLTRSWHGLTRSELVDHLFRLNHRGDILINDMAVKPGVRPSIQLSWDEFADEVDMGRRKLFYRTSSQGGDRWEVATRPDWNRFIVWGNEPAGSNPLTAFCSSKDYLNEFLANFSLFTCGLKEVDLDSVVWGHASPWKPLWWKTLPVGHQSIFRYRPLRIPAHKAGGDPHSILEWYRKSRDWIDQINGWYKKPFDYERPDLATPSHGHGSVGDN